MLKKLMLLLLVGISLAPAARSEINFGSMPEFLPVDEAYQFSYYLDKSDLVFDWVIAPEYYLYKDRFTVSSTAGSLGEAIFSDNFKQKYDENFDETMWVYHDYMSVRYPITSDQLFEVKIQYQGCADAGLCYPPQKKTFQVELTQGTLELVNLSKPIPGSTVDNEVFVTVEEPDSVIDSESYADLSLISALIFALIGGLILNLMPCVFPILSLKALHLAQASHEHHQAELHGWVYTFGVVISFVLVAAVLMLFRTFGEWVGWGFQLQSPYFIAFLIYLFFALALVMAGMINIGNRFMGIGQSLTEQSGLTGTFFTGVLATVVATPCTAPFMGAALGYALVQPVAIGLLVFAFMGLGLALPVLAVSHIPWLGNRMPKPGPWMEAFKQILAFPLMATVVWLLWVLLELKGTDFILYVGVGLVMLAFACWPMLNRQQNDGTKKRVVKLLSRYSALVISLVLVFNLSETEDPWVEYSPSLLNQALDEGRPVFVNVTAAWCITCKVNERVALSGDDFVNLVKDNDILLVSADWTQPSPEVDQLINDYGRNGVPLYLFYQPGGQEVMVLPQLLTEEIIRKTFTKI